MNFLLEIGTEEIPHWMIPGALAQLAKLDLFGATARVDATPRRLVVRAEGLPDRTPDQEQLIKGPPIAAGDKAAQGFAKKQGVDPSAMQKSGDYYELRKKIPGRSVRDLLAESLPASILGIQWPKTMYWGAKGGPRFIRPIRWIVALLEDEVIGFEVAGVRSGDLTRGHRIFANREIKITSATIETELRANVVILSADERRNTIKNEAAALGATIDLDLLETLTYITEYPAAIKGDFDASYLELPAEVLTMVMRHHQKYFAVETSPGVLSAHFVAVMNVPGDPDGLVKRGNERVLKARFNDARFFWEVDQRKKLADRVDDLSHVTFQAKLGTYLEKTDRVVALVKELGGDEDAKRAALLAKADLTTDMVKEFTDLQGIVGGLYAKAQGESEAISQAIYEHYKPLSMEDSIPSTPAGQILAIADKLDSLKQFFRVDMIPRGSSDPFALRRAAQGIVKILTEGKLNISFDALIEAEPRVIGVAPFLFERIETYFRDICGFKYDEVNAVMPMRTVPDFLWDVKKRLQALAKVRPTENFDALASGIKRVRKIIPLGLVPERAVDVALLEDGAERDLYNAVEGKDQAGGVLAEMALLRSQRRYEEALQKIASLRPFIDAFFDNVMVNVPDEKVRANRLALLHRLLIEFSTIADFSEIVTSGDQK